MYVKEFQIAQNSLIEADDVANHQNSIGETTLDRKVVCLGEAPLKGKAVEGITPLVRYLVVTTTKDALKEVRQEFLSEVPWICRIQTPAETSDLVALVKAEEEALLNA